MAKKVLVISSSPRRGENSDLLCDQFVAGTKKAGHDKVLFGEVWERPGLSKRDRSLITVAALVAGYRTNELPFHLSRAIENGVTKSELIELITHLRFLLWLACGQHRRHNCTEGVCRGF